MTLNIYIYIPKDNCIYIKHKYWYDSKYMAIIILAILSYKQNVFTEDIPNFINFAYYKKHDKNFF